MMWVPRAVSTRWMRAIYRSLGFRYYYSVREAVGATAQFYASTKRTLFIVSGELAADVWAASPVVEALVCLTRHTEPVTIEIVLGPPSSADPRVLGFLGALARQGSLSLYTLNSRPALHFAVADARHVKVEDPHEAKAQQRTGYVAYNVPWLAALLGRSYRFAKQRARPFAA